MQIGWETWKIDEDGENPWDKHAFRGVPTGVFGFWRQEGCLVFLNSIPSDGTSLVVQWLRPHAPKTGAQVQSLVSELRSHRLQLKIPHATAKTQHSRINNYQKYNTHILNSFSSRKRYGLGLSPSTSELSGRGKCPQVIFQEPSC